MQQSLSSGLRVHVLSVRGDARLEANDSAISEDMQPQRQRQRASGRIE